MSGYLLDTNVVSSLRRRDKAAPELLAWVDGVSPLDFWISVITVMEIELGAALVARRDPAQGDMLQRWIMDQVLPSFGERILPVDLAAARRCARLHVPDPRPERDALIGATALIHGLTLVTRNVTDFKEMQISLIDPWNDQRHE